MARERTYLIVTDVPRFPALGTTPVRTADEYLEGKADSLAPGLVVVNLCRSYQYLSKGYYVSLLAHARRQRVMPTLGMAEEISNPFAYFRALQDAGIDTIDFKIIKGRGRRLLPTVIVIDGGEGNGRDALLDSPETGGENGQLRYERTLKGYCEVTSVFGRTPDDRFRRQCAAVFKVYPFPLLRIRMYEEEDGWCVGQIFPGSISQLNQAELDLLAEQLPERALVATQQTSTPPKARIACLLDPDDPYAPSDEETVEKLGRIAARQGVVVEAIDKDDLSSLPEYDALFIRTVTAIDNYAFTFAKVAESLDMPVIDDPQSIIRCSNKVYLYELFRGNGIPIPRTWTIARKTDLSEVAAAAGLPLIVKLPGGTFSAAVKKVNDIVELEIVSQEMFAESPLLIVQEFTPTAFDWRVTVLENKVLFVCKYHMVKDHWQIAKRSQKGGTRFGRVEAVAISATPEAVVKAALEATGLIGQGLYGVDIKETEAGPVVIEINDNPNLEAGYEDAAEKDSIYETIIAYFLRRIEAESRTGG